MNIGERIKKLRTEKLMTQAELAGDRITRNMLSLIEKGHASPSVATLEAIADKLNVSSGFLLANEKEEAIFRKSGQIAEIRLAFEKHDFRICYDMCRKLGKSVKNDDEINMILAFCALEIGKEELFSDRIRSACAFFDESLLYAGASIYDTSKVRFESCLYFSFLENLSPSLVAENMDGEEKSEFIPVLCPENSFERYLMALSDMVTVGLSDQTKVREYDYTQKHLEARRLMKSGNYDAAFPELESIIKESYSIPGAVLYYIFEDLEECCEKTGNEEKGKYYARERITLFEKLFA